MKIRTKYFRILLLVICVAVIGVLGFANYLLNKIKREDEGPSRPDHEILEPDRDIAVTEKELKKRANQTKPVTTNRQVTIKDTKEFVEPAISTVIYQNNKRTVLKNKNVINIMLIGEDRREKEFEGRSDTMILATFNQKDKSVKLTSFMRDLYVHIPGYKNNRLNASYQYGGMKLLKETIEENFLVHVDGNVAIDFEGFTYMVDKVGGIEIELNSREARYFGKKKAGLVNMDGRTALIYARLREIGNSDYERTERQKRVISAAYEKITKMKLYEVIELANDFLPKVTTDLTNFEILMLATKVISMDFTEPETLRIPAEGAYKPAVIRGMEVLKPDIEENRRILKDNL